MATCLSNIVSDVHSASIKSGGFGTFASSQPYPIPIAYEKCVQNNGNLYCFGGIGADEEYTTNSYYASLTSNGISSWTQTMSYPENGSDYSCAVIDGDAVCVGGGSRNVYYTGLTANGVSGWKALGGYPLPIGSEECVISGNALCCIGGGTGGLDITNRTYCADIYVLDSAS